MSTFKSDQRHLTINGRHFHFVSYEGRPANERSGEPAAPPTWYLMVEGRRCPVFPCIADRSDEDLESALAAWIKANALGPADQSGQRRPAAPTVARRRGVWREPE